MRLVISSGHNRPDASGLYLFDGSSVRLIDRLPSGGLSVFGENFYRGMTLRHYDGAEILVYDARGICRYLRVDDVGDPHDILALDERRLLCVSSRDNAIVSVGPDGRVEPYWRADAPLDSWHVNCVTLHDGRLFATAFGRSNRFRGWLPTAGEGTGILLDLERNEPVITGLSQPHTPRRIDDAWVLCNSAAREVVRVESNGHRFAVPVGGFSRGMCAVGDFLYVGVSAPRGGDQAAESGSISIIDRERWTEVDRIQLPFAGMYDIIEVDESIMHGLDAGFRVACERERYFGQLAMFEQAGITPHRVWAIADPLLAEMCRVKIGAELPATLALGDVAQVTCTVENAGNGFLVPAPPFPVEVCYRWFDQSRSAVGAGTWLHTRLPRVLPPGGRATFKVMIAPPPVTGRFTLRLTLLQEGVHWFDDIDPANGVSREVEILDLR